MDLFLDTGLLDFEARQVGQVRYPHLGATQMPQVWPITAQMVQEWSVPLQGGIDVDERFTVGGPAVQGDTYWYQPLADGKHHLVFAQILSHATHHTVWVVRRHTGAPWIPFQIDRQRMAQTYMKDRRLRLT